MKLAIEIARLTAWIAVTALCAMLCGVVYSGREIPQHVAGVIDHANGALEKIDSRTGVLARVEGIESQVNASAKNLAEATDAWKQSADAQAHSVADLVETANGTLGALRSTAETAQAQMAHVGPLLDSARAGSDAVTAAVGRNSDLLAANLSELQTSQVALEGTLGDVDGLLRGRELHTLLDGASATSENLAGISGDFRGRFHALLYPAPCRTLGCKLGRQAWPVVKDSAAFGESLYWTGRVLQLGK